MKHWLLSALSFLLLFTIYGQSSDLVFKHLTRAGGLPVDDVTCITQDSTGFIWIGSKEGLFRYDGFGYKSFYHQPGNDQTIPNNFISKIFVDKEGLLWVGTSGGLVILKNNGEIIALFTKETNKNFSGDAEKIFDIHQSGKVFWVSTSDGIISIQKQNKGFSVQKYDLQKKFSAATNQGGDFIIDREGRLWICSLRGLMIFDPEKNILFHSGNNPQSLKILDENVAFKSIFIDENRQLVYYTTWEPAEKIYDLRLNKVKTNYNGKGSTHPDFTYMVSQYLKDKHGTIWISSGKGIKLISAIKEIVFHHLRDNNFSLIDDDVHSLLIDKEENLWVATSKGISIAKPYRQSVVNFSLHNADRFPFAKFGINTIIPVDSSTNLVGTGFGIFRTDSAFNVLEHYSFGTADYDWIWTYYKLGDSIFISTQKGNLLYHIHTTKLEKLNSPPFDRFFPVFSYSGDKDGSVWMSRYFDDFMKYDSKNKTYRKFSLSQLGEPASVMKIETDRDNQVWILSSLSGVLQFDQNKQKISSRLPLDKKNGLINTHIIVGLDLGNDLFIGYVYHGFSLYNKRTKTFRHFSHADGLASNSITDAVQTDENTIWIATLNGISRFDLNTKSFLNYGYDDGMLQNDFGCISQLADGRIAAGSNHGMVYFYPNMIRKSQQVNAPLITSINVYGQNLPVDFTTGFPLSIAYDKNYFSVEFISLNYSNSQQIEYAYQLDGYDKDWIYAGNRRFISYSNLPGGEYKLKLKAHLPGSDWSETISALAINVGTPYYKTWWFILACGFVLISLAYLIFRYRIQQLLQVEKMRQSISSDLHDEVGASLSSISIFSEMARQSLASGATAENYIRRIGERSRESIEKMGDIIWSINPENDSMQQMLTRMKTFVNETLEGKDITIQWHESESVRALKLSMAERKNYYLLFKEAFINAVKYSQAKNIEIVLKSNSNNVFLKISDNGKGFCTDSVKHGNGIKNIKQRATQLGGKVVIESTIGVGTSIILEFPC